MNLEIVKGLYASFAQGDVPAVLATFSSDIVWNEAESSTYADRNPYVGHQAILEGVFMRAVADVDGFTATPESFVDGGDVIVTEGRYRGHAKASDKPLDTQFAHIWTLLDGKIVRFQQYTDSKQWSDLVGG